MGAVPVPRAAFALASLALVLAAGCASAPSAPAPAQAPAASTASMLAIVRAAGEPEDTELAVRPLRDPATADLRDQAAALLARGDVDAAAGALDQALAVAPGDPALLQERAEVALLAGDFAGAAALAGRAHALGSGVGPLCRRHWATIWQARVGEGRQAEADAAQARIDACRLDRPARY